MFLYSDIQHPDSQTLLERSQVQLDLASKMKKAVVLTQQHDFEFYNAAVDNW